MDNSRMNLLDKLVHALKSAVNDVVSTESAPADKQDATLRLIEKAEAKLDILKADIARAEKKDRQSWRPSSKSKPLVCKRHWTRRGSGSANWNGAKQR